MYCLAAVIPAVAEADGGGEGGDVGGVAGEEMPAGGGVYGGGTGAADRCGDSPAFLAAARSGVSAGSKETVQTLY